MFINPPFLSYSTGGITIPLVCNESEQSRGKASISKLSKSLEKVYEF